MRAGLEDSGKGWTFAWKRNNVIAYSTILRYLLNPTCLWDTNFKHFSFSLGKAYLNISKTIKCYFFPFWHENIHDWRCSQDKKNHKLVFYSKNKRKEEVCGTSLESEDIYFWHWKACIQYEVEQGNLLFSFLNWITLKHWFKAKKSKILWLTKYYFFTLNVGKSFTIWKFILLKDIVPGLQPSAFADTDS